jgi:hypothetical protein
MNGLRVGSMLLALCLTVSIAGAEEWVSLGPAGLPISNGDVIDG